jgi:tRNA 2-thiouridine synthesizing protein B
MLHLIFQSPIDPTILDRMAVGDVAVFFENAALDLLQNSLLANTIAAQIQTKRLCVLSEDMAARGILVTELATGLEAIGYPELVDLTIQNPLIQSWY